MARKQFQTLSEPMYYILLALTSECCGVDIMKKVEEISKGRISVGPGTLYTLLGKFESSDLIRETEVQGRKIELSKLTKKKRDAKPEQVK